MFRCNGRIARALVEMALAQSIAPPTLIALAYIIQRNRKDCYFANAILDAQATTMSRVEFHVAKGKSYERMGGQLNERQRKAIACMFREGVACDSS